MSARAERFGPTRRGGPVFRWLGEPLAIDLANTVMVVRDGEEVDLLESPDDLRRWLDLEQARLGKCAFAIEHLVEIRQLRDATREAFAAAVAGRAPPRKAVNDLNVASARRPVATQLRVEEDGSLSVADQAEDRDSLNWLLAMLARSAIELLTGADRDRLRQCAAPSCGMFFIGARRWCCSACGNRARAARHYRRTRISGTQKPGRSSTEVALRVRR